MWQKFKTNLKCSPSPNQCCNKNNCKHLRTIIVSTLIKGEGDFFCAFDLLPHYYVHDCSIINWTSNLYIQKKNAGPKELL